MKWAQAIRQGPEAAVSSGWIPTDSQESAARRWGPNSSNDDCLLLEEHFISASHQGLAVLPGRGHFSVLLLGSRLELATTRCLFISHRRGKKRNGKKKLQTNLAPVSAGRKCFHQWDDQSESPPSHPPSFNTSIVSLSYGCKDNHNKYIALKSCHSGWWWSLHHSYNFILFARFIMSHNLQCWFCSIRGIQKKWNVFIVVC